MDQPRRLVSLLLPALALAALALAGCRVLDLSEDGSEAGDGGGGQGGSSDGGDGGGGEDLPRYAELIRSEPFPRLVVEVDFVPGFAPRPRVESDLAAGFDDILDKPKGVDVVRDAEIDSRGSEHAWSFEELNELAQSSFDMEVPGDTIKLHALFLDGHHERDDEGNGVILGLAWSQTHLVIFKQTMNEMCQASSLGPLLREQQCRGAELSVWIHEVGHLIGLVDNGLPMVVDHKDEEHGAHDVSDDCVMYWAYEGGAVFDQLAEQLTGGGDASLGFGDACLDDVAAVRDAASL